MNGPYWELSIIKKFKEMIIGLKSNIQINFRWEKETKKQIIGWIYRISPKNILFKKNKVSFYYFMQPRFNLID